MPRLPFFLFLSSFFNIFGHFLHSVTLNCNMWSSNSLIYMFEQPLEKHVLYFCSPESLERLFSVLSFSQLMQESWTPRNFVASLLFSFQSQRSSYSGSSGHNCVSFLYRSLRIKKDIPPCLHPYFPTATLLENKIWLQSFLADCTKQGSLTVGIYFCNGNFISGRDYPRNKTSYLKA